MSMRVLGDSTRISATESWQNKRSDEIEPHQVLANAIIIQAAEDYREALRQLKIHPEDRSAQYQARSIERFFESEWCRRLTKADPLYIRDRIRKEV